MSIKTPWEYEDIATGNSISLKETCRYIILTINNRAYYFNADDGCFDGASTELED